MASKFRRGGRRNNSSRILSILGTILLLLATLAVGVVAVYLVTYPPGVLDPASQGQPLIPPGIETATPSTAPGTGAVVPNPDVPTTGLSLEAACGAVNPLIEQADAVRDTSVDRPEDLDSAVITALTHDLQTVSNVAPPELKTLIDSLNSVLVALNNSVIAGDTQPELDGETATAATDAIRTLCEPPA